MAVDYYEKMGVRPFICGRDDGSFVGSPRYPEVEEAMHAARQQYVDIQKLLDGEVYVVALKLQTALTTR